MVKKLCIILMAVLLFCSIILFACEENKDEQKDVEELVYYTITFNNYDGTFLYSASVEKGAIPEYKGSTPIRANDSSYKYEFSGWSPIIDKATKDITYTAQYNQSNLQYYNVTFKNYDDSIVYEERVVEGTIINPTNAPIRDGYKFKYWDYDFSKPIKSDTSIYAKWAYYASNKNDIPEGVFDIAIPEGVTSMGAWAFDGCSSLESIEIPSSVISIGEFAFAGCSSLTSIEMPSSITSIGKNAFYGCSSLGSIEIPSSVTSIGDGAFYGCSSLTSIEIPSSVTSIGEGVFADCSLLEVIIVNLHNSKYDSRDNCNAIIETATNILISACKTTIIPSSVTSIGEGAFAGCSSLTSIEIPSSVTSIGEGAFVYCSSLTSIEIPSSVTSIAEGAFYGCSSLETAGPIGGNYNCCFGWDDTIPSAAFSDCSSLTSIEIPSSVTSIGDGAFYGCSSLTSIEIPSSVTSIGEGVFADCSLLEVIIVNLHNSKYDSRDNCNAIIETATNILISACKTTIIPSSVTSIGEGAFAGCSSLTSIEIPSSVTSIGEDAFSYCSSLASVNYKGTIVQYQNISKGPYYNNHVPSTCVVHCADGDTAF